MGREGGRQKEKKRREGRRTNERRRRRRRRLVERQEDEIEERERVGGRWYAAVLFFIPFSELLCIHKSRTNQLCSLVITLGLLLHPFPPSWREHQQQLYDTSFSHPPQKHAQVPNFLTRIALSLTTTTTTTPFFSGDGWRGERTSDGSCPTTSVLCCFHLILISIVCHFVLIQILIYFWLIADSSPPHPALACQYEWVR